uniref:Uncharacterized protein n=1 Tax=Globisporangium ultimum (strain ATCC 200006 / CBS 805.95 / DAOM BR144) TaxID=431595 RepID=K3WE40_GLOUD
MNVTRILRFFGLRSRHGHAVRVRGTSRLSLTRMSIRMSRVFRRRNASRETFSTNANANGARRPTASRQSTMFIPENEPVALDWDLSSSTGIGLRKSLAPEEASAEDHSTLVQQLILEELEYRQTRKKSSTSSSDSRESLVERAQALSMAFLEGRGSEVTARGSSEGRMTLKEEKQLRKSVAKAIRTEEKQQKKRDKLDKKRAKQYARAREFFEQTNDDFLVNNSNRRSSFSHTSHQSDSYCFDVEAAEAKWHEQQRASLEFQESVSLAQLSPTNENTATWKKQPTVKYPPRLEFLFFGGNPDESESSLMQLEVGHRSRIMNFQTATAPAFANPPADYSAADSRTNAIKINPTLVRNMPRPFVPTFEGFP